MFPPWSARVCCCDSNLESVERFSSGLFHPISLSYHTDHVVRHKSSLSLPLRQKSGAGGLHWGNRLQTRKWQNRRQGDSRATEGQTAEQEDSRATEEQTAEQEDSRATEEQTAGLQKGSHHRRKAAGEQKGRQQGYRRAFTIGGRQQGSRRADRRADSRATEGQSP